MNTNKLILGTVQFGLNYGVNNSVGKPTQDQVNEILLYAYHSGIRCLDTAESYGDAHNVIGKFHSLYPSKIFDVITKLPHGDVVDFESRIKSYYKQLNVARLKSVLFHSYDTYKRNRPVLIGLKSLKAEGMIESIGVSVYNNEQIFDVMNDQDIDVIQLPFNLLDNFNIRGGVLEEAKLNGKTIHTRSAFLQGLFFMPKDTESTMVEALKNELATIRNISEKNQISIQKIALNYCLQQDLIDNVLIGVDNLSQLKQNYEDGNYHLPQEIITEVNKIKVENIELLNPSLWN